MAVTFIKRSTIPVAVKGKAATNPVVSITDKGQMILNSLATKFLGGDLRVAVAYDSGTLFLFRKGSKVTEKLPDSEFWTLTKAKGNKDKHGVRGEGTSCFMAASGLLKSKETFGDNLYDYVKSGSQTFTATTDDKNGCIKFTLPSGALVPKPKVARVKKAKKQVVNGVAATPDSTVGAPVPSTPPSEEIILEV